MENERLAALDRASVLLRGDIRLTAEDDSIFLYPDCDRYTIIGMVGNRADIKIDSRGKVCAYTYTTDDGGEMLAGIFAIAE